MPTVIAQGGLSNASSDDEQQRLVNLLRTYCADEFRKHYRLTTNASGVLETIWSMDLPATGAWRVTADVTGRALIGGTARATYTRAGLFFRDGAPCAQEGATIAVVTIESIGAFDVSLAASGNGVRLQVMDDGVRTMSWLAMVRVEEV